MENKTLQGLLTLSWNPIVGRYLQADQDFQPGSLILSEKSIISGPIKENYPICPSCYKSLNSKLFTALFKCPRCKYPVCDSDCSNSFLHKDFECRYITDHKIEISEVVYNDSCSYIYLLRCLLLKEVDTDKWNGIKNLQSHNNTTTTDNKNCHILKNGFEKNEISQIFGICQINSFATNEYSKNLRKYASVLFAEASMISHSCIPNCRWEIVPAVSNGDFLINIWSTVDIQKGQEISIQYMDILVGTEERRKHLSRIYNFDCSCSRCTSPDELGSQFSSFICPFCGGDILSDLPAKSDSKSSNEQWICSKCSKPCDSTNLQEIIKNFSRKRDEIGAKHEIGNISKLLELLDEYDGRIFHSNHYLLFEIRDEVVQRIFTILQFISQDLKNELIHDSDSDDQSISLEKKRLKTLPTLLINNCDKLLDIVEHFYPGQNRFRGRLLCYKIYAKMWNQLLENPAAENQLKFTLERNAEIVESVVNNGNELYVFKDNFMNEYK